MVAWVVIDRRHDRQSLKSRLPRALGAKGPAPGLHLSDVQIQAPPQLWSGDPDMVGTFRRSDLQTCRRSHFGTHPPIHYPLSSHALTWNPFCNPFVFKFMHGMGGVYPLDVRTFTRFDAFPTYPLSFHILAHSFALGQSSTLLFSIDSALFAENHPGWGYPLAFRHSQSHCPPSPYQAAWHTLNDCPNTSAPILVSLGSTHAPPPPSHCSDLIALPAAPGGRGGMARRPSVPPSHSPHADSRPHSRSRRLLRPHRSDARGFRRSRTGRSASPRLESPSEKPQRQLGRSLPRRRRQPRRSHWSVGIPAASRLQRRHDGRPISRRQRRPHRHLWLARAQRYPLRHRRIGPLRSQPLCGRTSPLRQMESAS